MSACECATMSHYFALLAVAFVSGLKYFSSVFIAFYINSIIYSCSAEMLVNLGIPCVILGHSERRLLLGESNNVSSMKGIHVALMQSCI